MKNTNENTNVKKPFYKKWWFWAIVVVVLLSAMFGSNEEETKPTDDTSSAIVETTETPSEVKEQEEKLVFELVAGEQGEYGKMITYNKGTEFEENFYAFYVPVGTYTVTNVGKYMSQFNVYSDEIVKNDDGWDEVAESFFNKVIDVNKSETITVEEGQHIEIAEPSHFKLEQQ